MTETNLDAAAGWLIRQVGPDGPDERLFWSNADGWGGRATADLYTDDQMNRLRHRLPHGGEWVTIEEANEPPLDEAPNDIAFPFAANH